MNIYLAAQFSRHPEMRRVRDRLVALGHHVTSRWIDLHGGDAAETSLTPEELTAVPESGRVFAEHDVDDIASADAVVSFTANAGGGKGGRHVEFGLGLALGKRMIVVGPRENVFHTLQAVERYPDEDSFVRAMDGA